MLLPKLTKTRGCFVDLSRRDVTPAQLPQYEAAYRAAPGNTFHHRDGYRFWFVFPSTKQRDQFLADLESRYTAMGYEWYRNES